MQEIPTRSKSKEKSISLISSSTTVISISFGVSEARMCRLNWGILITLSFLRDLWEGETNKSFIGGAVWRTLHHAFCQGVLLGCFAIFSFAFCSCLFIFCFRPLSLSFLPLSPIAYLFFPLSFIFSPRGCRCVVSSVFAYFHEYSCLANNNYVEIMFSLRTPGLLVVSSVLLQFREGNFL